jgi:osmoprotectant transport system ATP-binding protein
MTQVDPAAHTSPAISLRDVAKSYDAGRSFALRALTLDVPAGSFVAVVGASGSGKTTLLKLINRLIEPSSGAVLVNGENVAMRDPVSLRRQIGYVFQGVGLFPHMTVAQNIAVTPRLLGWPKERIAARVGELLDLVRLPRDLAAALPQRLSGGQAQRVGVARALAADPRIVLMDEPFGAVDQMTRDALARDYRGLHDSLGLTSLMITHDLSEAVLMADRIAVLQEGRLVESGTPQQLLTHPEDAYVRELMAMPQRQAERVRQLREAGEV